MRPSSEFGAGDVSRETAWSTLPVYVWMMPAAQVRARRAAREVLVRYLVPQDGGMAGEKVSRPDVRPDALSSSMRCGDSA